MVCSTGLDAAPACAAIRARIARFDELPYLDNRGEPIVGATVPGLDPALTRPGRLVELLVRSVRNCLKASGGWRTERLKCKGQPRKAWIPAARVDATRLGQSLFIS